MAQVKSKQASKSRRNTPKQPSTSKSVAAAFEHHAWVSMLVDPAGAPAAQIPDMWPFPSQATKLRMIADVATNGDGNAVIAIGSRLNTLVRNFVVTASTGVFTTAISSTVPQPDYTAYAAAFEKSRATCLSITFTNYVTPENSQGMCGMEQCPEDSIAGYGTDALTVSTLLSDTVTSTIEEGIAANVYPMAEPTFSATHYMFDYMPTTLFVVKGAKLSSSIGQLEIIVNMEGISDPSSVHAGGSTIEPYDPVAHTIGTHVTQSAVEGRIVPQVRGQRRLTSHGRAIADASAATLGYGVGGRTGHLISQSPAAYREAKKRLKRLMLDV